MLDKWMDWKNKRRDEIVKAHICSVNRVWNSFIRFYEHPYYLHALKRFSHFFLLQNVMSTQTNKRVFPLPLPISKG